MAKLTNWLKKVPRIDVSIRRDTDITNGEKNERRASGDLVGDGKAVFFGDGTEDEYEEMLQKESKWYHKLKEWGLK